MAGEATFIVVGGATGKVFATDIGISGAAGWGDSYGMSFSGIEALAVGEDLRSHEASEGIIIRRVS
jgi:hypothetical protein